MAAPVLAFPEKSPPLAVMAAARLAGVALEAKPDAKAAKDAPSTLKFASGCAAWGSMHAGPHPPPACSGCGWTGIGCFWEALELKNRPVADAGTSWWGCPASCATSAASPSQRMPCMAQTLCLPARWGPRCRPGGSAAAPDEQCAGKARHAGAAQAAPPVRRACCRRSCGAAPQTAGPACRCILTLHSLLDCHMPPVPAFLTTALGLHHPAACRSTSGSTSPRRSCPARALRPPPPLSTTFCPCAPSWLATR